MQKLDRHESESLFSYHKRLVYGKLGDKTLGEIDYSELAPYVYGKEYSSDVARRMMYGSYKTLQMLENEKINTLSAGEEDLISEIDEKIFELKKEKRKMFDQRAALNKILNTRARQEELNSIIKEVVKNNKDCSVLPIMNSSNDNSGHNDLLISLNDIHYGAGIDNHWRTYNPEICKQMFSEYLEEIRKIAETHNSENCIVWANGDLISGNIHSSITVTNKEIVIKQIMNVSELIAVFLSQLSGIFQKVTFWSVAGNHSRIDKKEDALNEERLDYLIEWYLKSRLEGFKNIEIDDKRIDPTVYVGKIRGKVYCGVHGDFDSNPSKVQSLQQMIKEPIYCVLMGHMHHNKEDMVQGVKMIMAGSFLGMDEYCVSKRIVGIPQQKVCVCTEKGILCSYDIDFPCYKNSEEGDLNG